MPYQEDKKVNEIPGSICELVDFKENFICRKIKGTIINNLLLTWKVEFVFFEQKKYLIYLSWVLWRRYL